MLVEIDALSVGQLYLDQNKIEKNGQLLRAAQFEGYPPIEVYEIFPGQLTILDGNSRCYLLYLAGKKEVEVTFAATEEVETMIMRPLYEACLRWCQNSGVYHIADLSQRILPTNVFMEKWVGRCQQMIALLQACQEDSNLATLFEEALQAGKEPIALSGERKLLLDEVLSQKN